MNTSLKQLIQASIDHIKAIEDEKISVEKARAATAERRETTRLLMLTYMITKAQGRIKNGQAELPDVDL